MLSFSSLLASEKDVDIPALVRIPGPVTTTIFLNLLDLSPFTNLVKVKAYSELMSAFLAFVLAL